MANKHNYWTNWVNDAADHFNVAYPTIVSWHNPLKYTPIMLDKHNKLLDWVIEQMVERGFKKTTATEYVNKNRISRDKCLTD